MEPGGSLSHSQGLSNKPYPTNSIGRQITEANIWGQNG
jgi:hypothetical protein